MVAPSSIDGFHYGDRVRLLAGFLGWPLAPTGTPRQGDNRVPTFLSGSARYRFVRTRDEVPGGSIIRDEHGDHWYCPTDYLVAGWPAFTDGAAA